ncbi:MAG: hypothetical protein DLM71_04810 [Chloroflexi bacterium]|nr:MAG: hypothetical protein DLM71_04810 [Chloroflexota bacterium]
MTIGPAADRVNPRSAINVVLIAPSRALGISGVSTYLTALGLRLAACGDRVSLVELRPSAIGGSSSQSSRGFRRCQVGYSSPAAAEGLVDSLVRDGDDVVVHSHADALLPFTSSLARRWHAALLHTVHYQEPNTVQLLNEHQPAVIAVSEAIARDLRAAGYQGTIDVLHHFAEDRWLGKRHLSRAAASLRQHAEISPTAPVLLFAGRANSPVKGADLLVRSIPEVQDRVPDVIFAFAGPYWLPPDVQRIADSHAAAVRLLGFLSPVALHAAYATASVVAVPSRYEPFGLVALEAQAMGTPVVASRVGGLPEVVHPSLGRLLPTDASGSVAPRVLADALGEMLKRLRSNPAVREDLVAWIAENFNPADHIARLGAIYRRENLRSRQHRRHIWGAPGQLISMKVSEARAATWAGEQPHHEPVVRFDADQAAALAREHAAVFATSSAQRDEIASEAASRAWAGRERFRGVHGSLESWMFGIVRNVAREMKRREGREQRLWSSLWGAARLRTEEMEARVVQIEDVRGVFARLPAREQTVLYLRYWKDLSYDEISRRTGIRAATCRQLARRGLIRLGRYL